MSTGDDDQARGQEASADRAIEAQARDQTGHTRITTRVDESNLRTSYASAFRTSATAEEVILDFGLNIVRTSAEERSKSEIVFHANNRMIMNYYAAKRLALTLGMIIRRYEEKFGELELDAAKRLVQKQGNGQ